MGDERVRSAAIFEMNPADVSGWLVARGIDRRDADIAARIATDPSLAWKHGEPVHLPEGSARRKRSHRELCADSGPYVVRELIAALITESAGDSPADPEAVAAAAAPRGRAEGEGGRAVTEHERAGFEASLRTRLPRAEDMPAEEPARSEWLRGWRRGHTAIEACVDAVRDAAAERYEEGRAYGEASMRRALREAIGLDAPPPPRHADGAAWRRVRPALRALIAAVRAADKGAA